MLQHVTLEVAPEDIERSIEFWTLLGFRQVEPPPVLADTFTWLEREGTQIHLERNEAPSARSTGPEGNWARWQCRPSCQRPIARTLH